MGISAAEFQFHVLAVDDSLIDRKLIERLLKTSSYQVTTVDSGSKALEFLGLNEDVSNDANLVPVFPDNHHHKMDVNLVITDYFMPGMTGYDLLKKIKESSSMRNIPVVIMSSENVPSRIDRCLKEGAEEFFLKPVRLSDVNKLRPHLMKTICNEMPEKQEKQAFTQDMLQVPKFRQQRLQQQQKSQIQAIGTKRKVFNEGVLPERTRTILDGLPAFSNL